MKIIAHIDLDAFFASVEEREKPYLKGLPVVVGADPEGGRGRGVVSTANYKAREYGIHSAMPIRKAWEACEGAKNRGEPACVFITSGLGKYGKASEEVFKVVSSYARKIEKTSVDEAYLDFSHYHSFKKAREAARKLKQEIRKKTKLSASIGIGPSKLIAKIASDYEKPDGLTVVLPREVESFLEPLPIRAIPGVGKVAEGKLKRQGITTVRELKEYSWEELERLFGKWGFPLYERVRGIDVRDIETEAPLRKSIGKHHTFPVDTNDMKLLLKEVEKMAGEVMKEFKRKRFKVFKTVVLTIRFDDFSTYTRSLTGEEPLYSTRELELRGTKLLLPFFEKAHNPKAKKVRLLGLRVEGLS